MGGHVALDFVNTALASEDDPSRDVLRSGREFASWCAQAGVVERVPAGDALSEAEERAVLRDATRLRASVRAVVEAIAADRSVPGDALATLQSAFVSAIGHATPAVVGDHLDWQWPLPAPRSLVQRLASATIDLLRSGPTGRVKACPGCGFVFIDATRNGSRRWCSMEDCGTDEKIRRYLAKRARARASAAPGAPTGRGRSLSAGDG